MKKRSTLLFLLLLLLAVTVFAVSCGGNGDDSTDTATDSTGNGTDDTESADVTETEKEPDVPDEPIEVTYSKVKVTSSMITSSTPWNNGSDVAANAFDGKTSTFFDGVEEGWIRVDLGKERVIGKLSFAPRSGYESRLIGSFYGSRDGKTWYEIYDIKTAPNKKKTVEYDELLILGSFRFIKYQNFEECANISEIEIYSVDGIPDSMLADIECDTYADGSFEIFDHNPEDEGMTRVGLSSDASNICDYNPSTVYTGKKGDEVIIKLDKAVTIGAIAYMGGEDLSNMVGGEIYGSADGETWKLMHKIDKAPSKVKSEFVYYGDLLTTGKYSYIKYANQKNKVDISEIRVYGVSSDFFVALTTLPFATDENGQVNNIALNWGSSLGADKYEIYRSNGGDYELVYTGTGTSWQDYELPLGDYSYQMRLKYKNTVIESPVSTATAREMPDVELSAIDNQTSAGGLSTKGGICHDGVYYSYSVNVAGGKATIVETTSKDGYRYGKGRVVVKPKDHKLLQSCKIESVKVVYDEISNTVIIAAHWEKPDGYADGKLLLVTGTPGGEFEVKNIWNPLGIQVRDLSVFIDDDGQGYLFAAANKPGQGANATIYLFKFSKDFSKIESIVTTLFENQYREMPNCVKVDGWYYLFVSQTAGWYPSQGAYASTQDLEGDWSELRNVGNTSTFSSQSCWIATLDEGDKQNYIMYAYRWVAGNGTSGTMLAPITFCDGVAYYDYYQKILYNAETGDMIPLAKGKLLSQGAKITTSLASVPGSTSVNMTDGDYFSSYTATSATWPMTFTVDLGRVCDVSNIQLSWYICKGSEGYYMYTVEGSVDGETWEMLYDNTNESDTKVSKTYGFNSNMISGEARYIKVYVKGARLQNNPDYNWYTPTIYEVKIFGNEK